MAGAGGISKNLGSYNRKIEFEENFFLLLKMSPHRRFLHHDSYGATFKGNTFPTGSPKKVKSELSIMII